METKQSKKQKRFDLANTERSAKSQKTLAKKAKTRAIKQAAQADLDKKIKELGPNPILASLTDFMRNPYKSLLEKIKKMKAEKIDQKS